MKPYPLLVAGLAVMSATAIALTWSDDSAIAAIPVEPLEEEAASFVVTAMASTAELVTRPIIAVGRSLPSRQIELRTEYGGRATGARLPVGTKIAAGTPVCELDLGTLPARLAEAEARMNEARATLETAETLAARGYSPESGLHERHAALQTAEARLAELRRELNASRIVAPFDGVLSEATPEAGSLLAPMAPCATLVALDRLHVTLHLPEIELSSLDSGAPVKAVTSAGIALPATLHAIAPESDPRTGMVAVTVQLANDALTLRAGEMLSVRFQTQAQSAHRIPRSALILSEVGQLGVRLVEGDRSRFAPTVIVTEDAAGLLISGLPETVQIVTNGQHFLTDTTPIATLLTERP